MKGKGFLAQISISSKVLIFAFISSIWASGFELILKQTVQNKPLLTQLHILEDWAFIWISAYLFQIMLSQAQTLQKESYNLLRAILEGTNDAIFMKDLQGRYLLVNKIAAKILGKPEGEILGQDDTALLSLPDAQQVRQNDRRIISSGETQTIEERITFGETTEVYLSKKYAYRNKKGEIIGLIGIARNITDRHLAEKQLRDSEQRYRSLFESNPQPMWFYDEGTLEFLSVNDAAIVCYGYSREEFLAMTLLDIRPSEDISLLLEHISQEFPSFQLTKGWRHRKKDGTIINVEIHCYRTVFEGKPAQFIWAHDITEQLRVEQDLRRAAFYDSLTYLPNRTLFLKRLTHLIQHQQIGALYAVLLLDLDGFRTLKYSLGHQIADKLIVATATRLEQCLQPSDTLARLESDEFAILLPDLQNESEAIEIAECLSRMLMLPYHLDEQEVFATASIGIALAHPQLASSEDLLRAADMAMNHARVKGKERCAVFNPTMQILAVARLQRDSDLRRAISRLRQGSDGTKLGSKTDCSEFIVHYQPIVDLSLGEIVGFEALVRWMHPEQGMISPGSFIPLAEETGLISHIDRWVLRVACHQLQRWQQMPNKQSLVMSVNLSSKQLSEVGLVEQLDRVLQETGIAGSQLKLEITESAMMENSLSEIVLLQQLKTLGVQFSIDDFGTAYSSLGRLHQLPIDTLKIDRSFVQAMESDRDGLEIVRTISKLAHGLNMDVIAEGIETAGQIALLRSLGVEYGQGYFFSRPINSTTAEELLMNTPSYNEPLVK